MTTSNNICFIPAKSASIRLKKKNILKINGKELIYYPIKAAQESGLFNGEIFLSTESEEIRGIAIKYGAKVPYLRNEKLAHDPYGVNDVTLDFFDKCPAYKEFDNIFILLPTAPMIQSEDIANAFKIYIDGKYKYLMSATETEHNSLRSVFICDQQIEPVFPEMIMKKSQELKNTYRINGAITVMNIKDFLITKSYFSYPLGAYIMPHERSIDIDTEFDYKIAKSMMENRVFR